MRNKRRTFPWGVKIEIKSQARDHFFAHNPHPRRPDRAETLTNDSPSHYLTRKHNLSDNKQVYKCRIGPGLEFGIRPKVETAITRLILIFSE